MMTQFACSVIPSTVKMSSVAPRTGILPSLILAMVMPIMPAMAQVPDFTNGGVPSDTNNINLGPTGTQGWLYHVGTNSSQARQILVTSVAAGSPAAGILAVNDVILGVNGTGAAPVPFASDARVALGLAIGDAEARNPATLKLLRWRAGVTETVDITLQTLGAYSATAPYNCPKSAAILEQGLAHRTASVNAGQFGFGTLALLAGNDPSNPANNARQALAQAEARAMIATQQQIDFWKSGQIDTGSKITWTLGHRLVVLTEYYLQTLDPLVLPTIEAMAVQVANGQSHLGTMGHQLTNLNAQGAPNDAYNVGYGTINSAGMPTFLGLLLAKECGLTNPQIDPAIQRASRFYAAYTGYGAHPYGEHEPYRQAHESNGKSGLAALCFELLADRAEDGKFYSMMATAASSEREEGHTGSYFNQLWAPLGAAAGGEVAVAAHFSRIRWMLDLNREWDGGFYWNRLDGSGSGERWNDFDMSTAALLTYALPLRKLHITGRGHDPARYLTSQEVADAIAADDYDAATRTTSELVTDLGNWSPKVQFEAANEIGLRTAEHATLVPQLIAIANDTLAGESRVGACFALGEIGNGSAAADLAALLDDANHEVRYASAEALRYLPQANKLAQLNTILTAAASTGKPFFPIDEEDPMHFAHARLSMLLFYSGSAYGPKGVIWGSGINGVDRTLLYPAIEAVAATPFGQARSTLQTTYTNLTHDDVLALSGKILDSIVVRAPADKMFSGGVRTGGVQAMEMYDIADGVRACMKLIEDVGGDENLELLGSFGAGVHTVEPDPDVVGFLESYLVSNPTGARLALDEIATDINPLPLTALKTVQLTTADDPILNLPATSTVLRATAYDHAQGDSIYTWKKVFGPGAVTFTPNGTAAASNSTAQFDGTPGAYEFEVTMSDSRGLTESYGTVVVLVSDGSPADTTAPPATGFATAPTGTSISSVTMTAQVVTDPEGNGVKYYFTCTSGGGNDSGWQTSPTYTDTGLLPDTTYAYTVTVKDLSPNQNTSAASAPASGSTLGLPTSTLSEGVFHILGSSNTPTANTVHNVSVNGAYAGFKGQGNVGSVMVPVDETFNGTIVDYAFIRESATPDVIQTYADGGAGRFTFGSYLPRAGSTLGNSSDMKLWTVNDPGSPAYSNPANFTSSTGVGTFDTINGSIDISGVTVGSVYFFYSGYRSMPFFSATMKDAELVVADVPLPVFGDGDTANGHEHYVCSINFVNNDGCDTIDWSLTSSLYNGEPHCSLKGIVLVTSTGQTATVPNVVGLTQTAAQNSIKSAGFSVGSVLLRSSSTVPAGYVISQSPGNGSTAIKTSAVNLVVSNGLPTTPVPNVIGLEQSIATSQIVAEGLIVGNVTTEASTTVSAGHVISQSPGSGSLLVFGGSVNLVVAGGNSPPVANSGSAAVDEDRSVVITLTATDPDVEDTLTYAVVAGPTNGALSGTAPNLTYTPEWWLQRLRQLLLQGKRRNG
jgi:hypothetical protein